MTSGGKGELRDLGRVSPEAVDRASRQVSDTGNGAGAVGNLLKVIGGSVGDAIKAKKQERDAHAKRVLELSQEIALLETHELIGADLPVKDAA